MNEGRLKYLGKRLRLGKDQIADLAKLLQSDVIDKTVAPTTLSGRPRRFLASAHRLPLDQRALLKSVLASASNAGGAVDVDTLVGMSCSLACEDGFGRPNKPISRDLYLAGLLGLIAKSLSESSAMEEASRRYREAKLNGWQCQLRWIVQLIRDVDLPEVGDMISDLLKSTERRSRETAAICLQGWFGPGLSELLADSISIRGNTARLADSLRRRMSELSERS